MIRNIEGYKIVGKTLEYGHAQVGVDHVEPLRQIASMELLDAAKNVKKELGLRNSRVTFGFILPSFVDTEENARDRYINIVMGSQTVTNSWQLHVAIRDYDMGKRYSAKRERFIFECVNNHMLDARREVYIKHGNDDIRFDEENEPYQVVNYLQLANERPVNADDCVRLYEVMTHAVKRRALDV